MKTVRIDNCSFGTLVINGRRYRDDLLILPDGKILKPWRRIKGHQVAMDDLKDLINMSPEVIVVGTGVSGRVIPDKSIKSDLLELAIEFIAAPNKEAVKVFNRLALEKRTGSGFHLTC